MGVSVVFICIVPRIVMKDDRGIKCARTAYFQDLLFENNPALLVPGGAPLNFSRTTSLQIDLHHFWWLHWQIWRIPSNNMSYLKVKSLWGPSQWSQRGIRLDDVTRRESSWCMEIDNINKKSKSTFWEHLYLLVSWPRSDLLTLRRSFLLKK